MSIKLKGSTDGSVTLQAPADTSPTGTDKTFTLPTADGTSGQVLSTNGSGALSFANEGKILQVVQASTSTEVTVSTTTYTDIGLSASITPSSSSNKILVLANFQAYFSRAGGMGGGVKLFRGSTEIYQSVTDNNGPFDSYNGSASIGTKFTLLQYDSPATTSATTYKLQGRPYTTANSATAQFFTDATNADGSGTLTLIEVAA